MRMGKSDLLVVGDRVLVRPDNLEERTRVGLVLPQSVMEKNPVQSGRVLAVGPGTPIASLTGDEGEVWKRQSKDRSVRYIPGQAEVGDLTLFLRNEAVEVRYQGEQFLVVPQSAILLIIRSEEELE